MMMNRGIMIGRCVLVKMTNSLDVLRVRVWGTPFSRTRAPGKLAGVRANWLVAVRLEAPSRGLSPLLRLGHVQTLRARMPALRCPGRRRAAQPAGSVGDSARLSGLRRRRRARNLGSARQLGNLGGFGWLRCLGSLLGLGFRCELGRLLTHGFARFRIEGRRTRCGACPLARLWLVSRIRHVRWAFSIGQYVTAKNTTKDTGKPQHN